MRQHALGPYPIDPNLLEQGVPLDSRVNPGDQNIFGPIDGTPMPPGPTPAPAAPAAPAADPGTVENPAPAVAPSAFDGGAAPGPSVAIATYDPKSGRFSTPDGQILRQANLDQTAKPGSWTDLLPT